MRRNLPKIDKYQPINLVVTVCYENEAKSPPKNDKYQPSSACYENEAKSSKKWQIST